MKTPNGNASVVPLAGGEPRSTEGIFIDGRVVAVSQNQLLQPFLALARAVERLADAAARGDAKDAADRERASVQEAYRSLYGFFQALLPSARHELLDGLTYSASLLLVGEAIETGRVVAPGPATSDRRDDPGAGRADR